MVPEIAAQADGVREAGVQVAHRDALGAARHPRGGAKRTIYCALGLA